MDQPYPGPRFFKHTRGQQVGSIGPFNIATARGTPADSRVATRQTTGLSCLTLDQEEGEA
jgi:hypothetical protein